MLSIRSQLCTPLVALGLLAMTIPNTPAHAPNISRHVRPVHQNSVDLIPFVLTSMRLAGDAMFEHSVIISIGKQPKGDVVVSFKRPTSERMVTAGRKPVIGLMQMIFTSKDIELRPAKIPMQISEDYSVPRLSAVAEFGYLYLMKHYDVGNEFELDISLDISQEQGAYYVLLTPVPFTPDHYASVTVRSNSGKLEISSDHPSR